MAYRPVRYQTANREKVRKNCGSSSPNAVAKRAYGREQATGFDQDHRLEDTLGGFALAPEPERLLTVLPTLQLVRDITTRHAPGTGEEIATARSA